MCVCLNVGWNACHTVRKVKRRVSTTDSTHSCGLRFQILRGFIVSILVLVKCHCFEFSVNLPIKGDEFVGLLSKYELLKKDSAVVSHSGHCSNGEI